MIRSKLAKKSRMLTGINITPFTDVCLVLLIIFFVTAPELVKESQFNMSLPEAAHTDAPMPTTVTVRITPERALFVNEQASSFAALATDIAKVREQNDTRVLVVKADETVPYRYVIEVIDTARSVGVDQIGLATRRLEPAAEAE